MTDDEYMTKLEQIRDLLRQGHRLTVQQYPSDNPGQALQEIVRSYQMIEAFEHILASEKAKASPNRPAGSEPDQAIETVATQTAEATPRKKKKLRK